MDKKDYIAKALELLNDRQTYEIIRKGITPSIQRKMNNFTHKLHKAK